MDIPTAATFTCGDMLLRYLGSEGGGVSLQFLPASCVDSLVDPRPNLGATEDAPQLSRFLSVGLRQPEPLIQVRRCGDIHGDGFNPGRTLRYSASTRALRLREIVQEDGPGLRAVVRLATGDGLTAEHHLEWQPGWLAVRMWTEVINESPDACDLELVTSFSLGGLSPFAVDDAPGRLFVHRFRAGWSCEGRHERILAEDLGLERAWAPFSLMTERFGQVGTKPVRGFVPWAGIEDAGIGVIWAAHLEAPGSWQCEVGRRDDGLNICGGLADREFGHWLKRLAPGERLKTPVAWLTVCRGSLDEVCQRLLRQQGPIAPAPTEKDLPVMFNEWCTTWGTPSHDNLVSIADRLAGTGCRYLVIDAGWYKPRSGNWSNAQGDWQPSADLFPDGLAETCRAIRDRGLIPGLWFELEVAGDGSLLFSEMERFLTLDGKPIQAGSRRFLDFRREDTHDLLEHRVIDLLERCGIGYIKVDYNASPGLGCDNAESPGEGLRQHVDGVMRFFRRLRERLPELVIENCSSGGQRAEPAFGALADMHSFSDVHTCRDIPVVAANLGRLIPARQNQIWAVLMPDEDHQRLAYSLAAAFIGRMCLSGEIWQMDGGQMTLIREAAVLYAQAAPVIRDGTFRRLGNWSPSSRHLTGWQAVVRSTHEAILVIVHVFGDGAQPECLDVGGRTRIVGSLTSGGTELNLREGSLEFTGMPAWSAAVVLLA